MISTFLQAIVTSMQLRRGLHVILVCFLPDHRIGCRSSWFFDDCRHGSRDSKNLVWGIPGLVVHLAFLWTAGCIGPVNIRVALVGCVQWIAKRSSGTRNPAPLESRKQIIASAAVAQRRFAPLALDHPYFWRASSPPCQKRKEISLGQVRICVIQ